MGIAESMKKKLFLTFILSFLILIFFRISASAEPEKKNSTGVTEFDCANHVIPDPFADTIDLKNSTLMTLQDPGYGASQGMCVVDNRYIVIGRYRKDGSKDLMVYDVIEKKVKASNIFYKSAPEDLDDGTNVDLGHLNGLTYYNGYLYVSRLENYGDILRLRFKEDCSIVFDSVALSREITESSPVNISCQDDVFYWTASGGKNGRYHVYRSKNGFLNTELAFASDFGGLAAGNRLTKQGMTYDGNYLYFAFSGGLNVQPVGTETDRQALMRCTEKIIITTVSGEIVKIFSFSRGSYGEIEDVDTITVDGSTYLLINCNQNEDGVSCVYAVPLYKNTIPSGFLEVSNIESNLYYDRRVLEVYCDNTVCYEAGKYDPLNSNPFASGLTQDRFTSVYAALNFIKRHGCPATLYLTGEYKDLVFKNLPAGMNIVLLDAKIGSISFSDCPETALSGEHSAAVGFLKAEKSVILVTPGISLTKMAEEANHAIELYYTVLIGSFTGIYGYDTALFEEQSLVNVNCTAEDRTIRAGYEIPDVIQTIKSPADTEIEMLSLSYLGGDLQYDAVKSRNNVTLKMTIRNACLTEEKEAVYEGMLPEELCPVIDIIVPALISESDTGSDPVAVCSVCLSVDGIIKVYGDHHIAQDAHYILVTLSYITA